MNAVPFMSQSVHWQLAFSGFASRAGSIHRAALYHRTLHFMPPLCDARSGDDTTWIVVRAYNESTRLGTTLQAVCAKFKHVVVVDDGSSDATCEVAKQFPVWVVRHPVNCGAGMALATGLAFALRHQAETMICFDGDGQHDIEDVPRLLAALHSQQADIAIGSRFLGDHVGMPWLRWGVLKLGVWFTRLHSGLRVTDAHNGLRAFTRHAAEQIKLTHGGMAYASELYDEIRRLRLTLIEVPVTIRYTADTLAKGQSSWGAIHIFSKWLLGRILS